MTAAIVAHHGPHILRNAREVREQFFGRLLAQLRVLFYRAVQVGHISLVMFVVVQLHRRFIDGRLEGGIVVVEGRKFESHGGTPLSFTGLAELAAPRSVFYVRLDARIQYPRLDARIQPRGATSLQLARVHPADGRPLVRPLPLLWSNETA
jgi:hypothetical protein